MTTRALEGPPAAPLRLATPLSWVAYWLEVYSQAAVRIAVVGAFAGAVIALPHSGNWDLAGAWAVHSGMPVTTVAERLADADFGELYVGGARPERWQHVFASVQSLTALGVAGIRPNAFEVVVVDEFRAMADDLPDFGI